MLGLRVAELLLLWWVGAPCSPVLPRPLLPAVLCSLTSLSMEGHTSEDVVLHGKRSIHLYTAVQGSKCSIRVLLSGTPSSLSTPCT